jgi:hypothetical protein
LPKNFNISIAGAVTKNPWARPLSEANDNSFYQSGWNLKKIYFFSPGFLNVPLKHTMEARIVITNTIPVMIK